MTWRSSPVSSPALVANAGDDPMTNSVYCERFDGCPIMCRGLGLVGEFALTPWNRDVEPERGGWTQHVHVPDMWVHRKHHGHAAYWNKDLKRWLIVQRFTGMANEPRLVAVGRSLLGATAIPSRAYAYPLAVRIPLRMIDGATSFELPNGPCTCRRVGESQFQQMAGMTIEHRLTVSINGVRLAPSPLIFAESFTSAHTTFDGDARSLVFTADLRKLVAVDTPERAARFTADLLTASLTYADSMGSQGLVVYKDARVSSRKLATVRVLRGFDDVAFDVRLQTPHGPLRFVAFPRPPWFIPVDTANDVRLVLDRIDGQP